MKNADNKNNEDKTQSFIEKAFNPTPVRLDKLTVEAMKNLQNNEQIEIEHPNIDNLTLKIRRDFNVQGVLNVPTVFYGEKYIIEDTMNKVHPKHKLFINEEEMVAYIHDLLEVKTISAFGYVRNLREQDVKLNDIVEFENGKRGVIAMPEEESYPPNLRHIPLKADGRISKHRPRIIYGGDKFRVIGEYKQDDQ
ncbi:hypothetical protein PP175_25810 (plasmid) [Aneurinibacillus sp. Ricciae_BoGa-3]|uniref:hypothetical protein n=1 Tax=Aneurinibacillus sp. Ricciae_BoGa-3 TaxID=3022697 RepID=UPI002341E6BF|nr:hypothetical protein [Aneurinibacillus sp. Ricciae_BoGa-3]WCK57485.1 hypothetical protein PP175_25810 [Aneurinibacillus sp. Ricciae_BoGa-3]